LLQLLGSGTSAVAGLLLLLLSVIFLFCLLPSDVLQSLPACLPGVNDLLDVLAFMLLLGILLLLLVFLLLL
jgi:hypothetical protein